MYWTCRATEPWPYDQAAPALAAFLLPEAAGPCGSTATAVGAINAATQADGLTLLHRAVRCGSAAMLESLLSFGCAQGFCWRVRTCCCTCPSLGCPVWDVVKSL